MTYCQDKMIHKMTKIYPLASTKSIVALVVTMSACCSFSWAQDTQIKGFFDLQGGLLNLRSDTAKAKSHGFQLGQFDLFITSQIDDKTTFLGETVFEYDQESKSFRVDVERMSVRRSFNDNFNVSAGKFHTPFGYWNNA